MADPQRAGLKHFSWPDHVAMTSQGSDKETLLRSCPQPRNRRHAHVIAAPNLRKRFHALVPPLDRLAALLLRQLRPASRQAMPRAEFMAPACMDGESGALHMGGIACRYRAPTSRNGGHRRFVTEAEIRRSPVGGIAVAGPPTRTPGNGILPGATVTELIDVA